LNQQEQTDMTTVTTNTIESAAEIAARISNLKDLVRNADYTERAGLREEISQLENRDYPAAVEREGRAAKEQRAAELARIESELAKAGIDQQPIGHKRNQLQAEIDTLIRWLPARDAVKARQLAKSLTEIAGVWDQEQKLNQRVAELSRRRDELQGVK
jgi:hypothetical protein